MEFLKTDRCCFCMDLRTGGIVWGFFGIIIGISGILEYIIGLHALQEHFSKTGTPPETSLTSASKYLIFHFSINLFIFQHIFLNR